jgi:Chlamydia-phage Chp2 scaffold (Chlamy_scaf).
VKAFNTVRRRPRVQTVNDMPSKTVQSDVLRSEIRHVLAKYRQVGIVEHLRNVDLQFRDVSEFEDFTDLMRQSKTAEQVFMRLPSRIREVFDHDVSRWLDAAHDPEKVEALRPQLEKLGVLAPKVEPVAPPA